MHTRGTDFKFPMEWKAAVTLSGEITRDKTVQACMRMRQLGNGQSIAFWASYETDAKIQKLCQSKSPHECTPNQHVVEFICKNSQMVETENTVHWAAGAVNYIKKFFGHITCGNSNDNLALRRLLETVIDNELINLEEMYGDKQEAPLADIIRKKFNNLAENFSNLQNVITDFDKRVQQKIQKQARDVKRFVQGLDEEQERELETEKELQEECHIERRSKMNALKPVFEKKLTNLILQGATVATLNDLMGRRCLDSLAKGLENTQLIQKYTDESDSWSAHIMITRDFYQVLSYGASDEYLRPVWWVALVNEPSSGRYCLILLSSFECDRLLPAFKKSKHAALYMFRPKLSKLQDNLIHQTKLQVSGMQHIPRIEVHDEVQIALYSGTMYFSNEIEQNAYCNFLGLIPRPRSGELESAFKAEIIEPNGYVPPKHRLHSTVISTAVDKCKFTKNPADLATKLIEAYHRTVPEECHAFSILKRGVKLPITKN